MKRISMLAAFAATSSLCAPLEARAQQLPMKHKGGPTQTAITEADAMTRVYIFADDSMMGRRAGTPGDTKATAYIEREVRRLGLVPAGDNGTFFQAVPLYNRSLDVASKLSADDTPLVAAQDYFPLHPAGVPRSLNGAQVIYAGNTADTTTLIPAAQAAGKVVLFSGPTPGIARRYPAAAAFMIPRTDAQMPQIRNFVAGVSQQMKSADDTVRNPMTIAVPVASIQKFLGVPMESARPGTVGRTLRGDVTWKNEDIPARNVVAILPGSDPKLKNQYVAIGAHSDHDGLRRLGAVEHDSVRAFNTVAKDIYLARTQRLPGFPGSGLTPEERAKIKINLDSLHSLKPARLDSIYNGADDDASGSMAMLEIAEYFAGQRVKPKRSLLFVWHTAEESGLYGSEFYTGHPTVPRDSIVAQLNVDMIGRGRAEDIPGGSAGGNSPGYLQLLGSRRLSTELGDLVERVNTEGKHNFKFDYTFDAQGHPEQYYCRSDHYEYAKYGIPIVFMSTGGHIDYHQLTDEPQYIDYPHYTRVIRFLGAVASEVANLDHRLVVDKQKPDPKGSCVQ
jgi:hypothetical protein